MASMEVFGREVIRPEREVDFTGKNIADFIQSQFNRTDKVENQKRADAWNSSNKNGEPPKEIHTKVFVKPFVFGKDTRRRSGERSERRRDSQAGDKMICYYLSMSDSLRDRGNGGGQIANIYNVGNDEGVKIRPAYWQMLQTMVYRPEFRKLMLDDRENASVWQAYGLGSREAREKFFALTKPHIIKGENVRIGILLNPDYVHKLVMTRWLLQAHPELKGTPFDVEIESVKNSETANWLDWVFRLVYVPRTNEYDGDTSGADAIQAMVESINNIR